MFRLKCWFNSEVYMYVDLLDCPEAICFGSINGPLSSKNLGDFFSSIEIERIDD